MAYSVSFAEMHGYPVSKWESGEFDAERRVLVAWGDRVTFLEETDSYPNCCYPYGDGPSSALAYKAVVHPFSGMDGSSGFATYEFALIQIFYSTRGPVWDTDLSVLMLEEMRQASQYGIVSKKNLKWASDGAELGPNDEPRLDSPLYEYTISFSRLLALPAWVLTRPGIVNAGVVSGKQINLAFPAQTLRYTGCDISCVWSMARVARFNVTARYLVKLSGWNKFWRTDGGPNGTGGWESLKTTSGNDYIQYEPVAMTLN